MTGKDGDELKAEPLQASEWFAAAAAVVDIALPLPILLPPPLTPVWSIEYWPTGSRWWWCSTQPDVLLLVLALPAN